MDYNRIINFLTLKFGSCYQNSDYYSKISEWLQWYSGNVPDFHKQIVANGINTVEYDIKKLKMAKRVAEDWASAIMSEGVSIVINGNRKTKAFINGSNNNGGVLGSNNFEEMLSNNLERMFALGTSAIVCDLDNLTVTDNGIVATENTKIALHFYDATRIIPLRYKNNVIQDVAFVSKEVINKETYFNISAHTLESDGYVIRNYKLNDNYNLVEDVFGDNGLRTLSQRPMFSIIRTGISNNIDLDSPMGVSVYADSIDVLKSIDVVYDACSRDVATGQRIILMNKKLLCRDDKGNFIAPQDMKKTYMMFFGDEVDASATGVDNFIKEFTPKLNCEIIEKELQNQLNMLSNKVGLGTRFYNFDVSSGVTATEYVGERNDFIRNSNKMKIAITSAIKNIVISILYLGGILGKQVQTDCTIDVSIADGVVESDKDVREQDRQDIKDGIMSKAEYRAKYYGEPLDVALKNLPA